MEAGQTIARIVVAYEAGRDGFWLERWLIARGIEVHVIRSASVAVSRERKRAKTDRLDVAMLMRVAESGYGCNAVERMAPPPRSFCHRSGRLLHGCDPNG